MATPKIIQQNPFEHCATGKTYFISCKSFGEQLPFASSALCVQMIELMKYYRSERILERKRMKEHLRVSVLSYSILPDQYLMVIRQHVHQGVHFFCTHVNEAITSYYHALFKTKVSVFSRYPIVTEILDTHELFSAIRHVNLFPLDQDLVRDSLDESEYPWSSYHELAHKRENPLVDDRSLIHLFGSKAHCRRFIQTGQV